MKIKEKTAVILFIVLSFFICNPNYLYSQIEGDFGPLPQKDSICPQMQVWFADPVFDTRLIKITDNKIMNIAGIKPSGIFPQYSKRQGWNCNGDYLLLCTGNGETLLFNGVFYEFIKVLDGVAGDDIFWDSVKPDILYYVIENVLFSYNVKTSEKKTIHVFKGYNFADTRGEGNLSTDGRYYAIAGRTYNDKNGEVKYKDILVYDFSKNLVIKSLPLPTDIENFDWVSVSPSGKYVVIDYADTESQRFHGVEVYDINLNFIWQKPIGAGHSDIGFDEKGNEVLVMDVYDENINKTIIKKFNLADGRDENLLELSPLFDLHISCRNINQKGWCIISTFDYVERLTHSGNDWLSFEDEIFALKLDASGDVKRIAHHHSRRYSPKTPDSDQSMYWAEPHATVSPDGNRIIFGSNWGINVGSDSAVDTYLIDIGNKEY